jgi:hypothetical protein
MLAWYSSVPPCKCWDMARLIYERVVPNPLSFHSCFVLPFDAAVDASWNVMAHGDAWKGKWRGNCRMEWVASTLHTTSEHRVSSITTADAHTSAANSRLNWRPRRFKWTRPFRRKTKSSFCACAITFQTQSTERIVDTVCLLLTTVYNFRQSLLSGIHTIT